LTHAELPTVKEVIPAVWSGTIYQLSHWWVGGLILISNLHMSGNGIGVWGRSFMLMMCAGVLVRGLRL